MADKAGRASWVGVKPVPMKLFATWEVEKSSPNCIPRLCSLRLTRLVITKPLENDLTSVIIAVKMQSSKRILRSNEILMPINGLLDTELDLSFSLQYPHFLKRDGNKLQVLLQRRKKYKNRTILGYKTLALGQVNMAQVLQRSVDRELNLYSEVKDQSQVVAQVMMLSLSSQPVDHEENGRRKLPAGDEISDEEADEQAEDFSSNEDMSDSEPIPGEEDRPRRARKSMRGPTRPFARQRNIKQKFIALLKRFKVSEEVLDSEQDQDLVEQEGNPQDIEDLFDELENLSESDPEMDTISVLSTPKPKLRPFFTGRSSTEILDVPKDPGRLSDDSSKRNDSDSHLEYFTDPEHSDPQTVPGTPPVDLSGSSSKVPLPPKSPSAKAKQSVSRGQVTGPQKTEKTLQSQLQQQQQQQLGQHHGLKQERGEHGECAGPNEGLVVSEPRKALLDQLAAILASDDALPDTLTMVNTSEWQGQLLAQVLQEPSHRVICTCSSADVRATISSVVSKIQKLRHGGNFYTADRSTAGCNSNSRAPSPIKIAVCGSDSYVNSVLRPYIEQFSAKSPDWQCYIKFLVIPLGASSFAKYLSIMDATYSAMFNDCLWKDAFEKAVYDKTDTSSRPDMAEVGQRVSIYLKTASHLVQLPVAEAMLTYRDKHADDDSSQIFVPFINEVRIGPVDTPSSGIPSTSVDLEESGSSPSQALSSSPPQTSHMEKARDNHTPPNSPNISTPASTPGSHPSQVISTAVNSPPEFLDLQLDYWTAPSKSEGPERLDRLVKKDSKSSLKTTFRSVQVFRSLPGQGADPGSATLSMMMVTKEKKQKIMRIGKKSKDQESKSQVIDGINRLICTSKSQSHPLTVTIDGTEWLGVKFFQLSAQWQTHIKNFPVLLFDHTNTNL